MSQNTDRDDDGKRVAELDTLSREIPPPEALEERVVAALRDEGLIRQAEGSAPGPPARSGSIFRPAAMAAGVLLMALLGFAGGRLTAVAPEAPRADYMLLVKPAAGGSVRLDADEELERFKEYSAWYGSLASRGEMVGGEKLTDEPGIVLEGGSDGGGARERSGSGGEIEGYFLIRAGSDDEARRIASSCPHLRYGGVIELRRIDRMEERS
jgi:hypothetical protein